MSLVTNQSAICHIPLQEVLIYTPVFHREELNLDLYAPRRQDYQQAHDHDELYFIVRGQGQFRNGSHFHPFSRGDCLFVPAGVDHCFESFSEDFLTWVMYWGQSGGEAQPAWPADAAPIEPWRWTPGQALADMDPEAPLRSILQFTHGSLRLKYYAPRGHDPQQPHDQHEIYIIDAGRARIRGGQTEFTLGVGDAVFVAAGQDHRFVDMDDGFGTWVAFYGDPDPPPATGTVTD